MAAAEGIWRDRRPPAVQPLEHLPQALCFSRKGGDVFLKLAVPLAQIGVLPHEVFQMVRVHRPALQPSRTSTLGRSNAPATSSADAMKSDGISSPKIQLRSRRWSPSIEIGRFGGLVSAHQPGPFPIAGHSLMAAEFGQEGA